MTSSPGTWRERMAVGLRRRRPSATIAAGLPDGIRFGAERGPNASILVPVAVIGLMGDLPVSMVLVSAFHPAHPLWVHGAMLVLALAAVGWAVAARGARMTLPHVLTADVLMIRDGFELAAEVPLPAVVAVQVISDSRRAWLQRHGVARRDVLRASLLDPPNLVIEVDVTAAGLIVMRRRRAVAPRRWIMLYADTPVPLAHALIDRGRGADDPTRRSAWVGA